MFTSKQRAYLRSLASNEAASFQIGKNGVSPEVVESVNELLEARELVKGTVLNNCADDIHLVSDMLSSRTHSDIVQVIGKKIVLYRKSKKPVIELPKCKN